MKLNAELHERRRNTPVSHISAPMELQPEGCKLTVRIENLARFDVTVVVWYCDSDGDRCWDSFKLNEWDEPDAIERFFSGFLGGTRIPDATEIEVYHPEVLCFATTDDEYAYDVVLELQDYQDGLHELTERELAEIFDRFEFCQDIAMYSKRRTVTVRL